MLVSAEEINQINMGQSPPSESYNRDKNGLPFYQGKAEFGDIYPTPVKWCSAPKKTANKGDILISVRAPVGPTNMCNEKSCIGRGLAAISPRQGIESKYIFYAFRSLESKISSLGTGTTFQAISGKVLRSIKIPLFPLPEQRAIVGKIEQLFSDLDNGIANLKQAREQLKVYRQAVLKKAFEGELTKEWRELQTNLPSAVKLLKQIKTEREKHYAEQLENWKQAVINWEAKGKPGKKPAKPRKPKELPPLVKDEIKELADLPNSMVWTKLGNIVWSVKDGPHYSPKYSESGIPFISGGNIRPTGIDFSNTKYISKELHEELSRRCKPEIDDVLYTKGGTTGIARVNTYDIDFNVWVHVAVLKTIDLILPFYLQHVLNSNHCYKQSQKYTHGVGNQDLGLTRMILITIPVCSVKEQEQIISEIESRLSVCDNVEANIEASLQQSEALRQSILKKAFEGKLLSESELAICRAEPDYEPAEKLLKRIKSEKTKGEK